MQKKWKISAVLMIAAVGMMFGACRHQFSGFYSPEERIAHLVDKIENELALEAAQKEELQDIVQEVKVKLSDLAQKRQAGHQEITALVRRETITQADLNEMMERRHKKMEELADFAGQEFIRFHTMLSPEQREKLATIIESHLERHHHYPK